MEISLLAFYALIGATAGLLGGLLGVGGGLVVVPALAWIFREQGYPPALIMHLAVGTSLASIIITAGSAAWAHHRRGAVLWKVVGALSPGLAAGALIGGVVARLLATATLRRIFGTFVLLAAAQLLTGRRPRPHRQLPRPAALSPVGAFIGVVSALVGIGGGTITVPFLLWCNVPVRDAVGTSAAAALPIALAGTASFVLAGWDHTGLPTGSLGYVLAPAIAALAPAILLMVPLGTRLAHSVPTGTIRKLFGGLVLLIGVKMLLP